MMGPECMYIILTMHKSTTDPEALLVTVRQAVMPDTMPCLLCQLVLHLFFARAVAHARGY